MRRFRAVSAVSATALVVLACNAPKPVPSKAEQTPAAAATPTASPGDAKVVGKAPAAKGGLPAVVLLHPREPREFPAQTSPPVMDQVSQSFTPSVLFVRTGQASEFRNSDDVLHNVRVRNDETRTGAFNVAIPTGGTYTFTFEQDGFYDVGCDIHPGMSAVVVSSSTPYAALAGVDGAFSLADVVPGPYTLTIYADVRKLERRVDVVAGTTELGSILD
jgi:plastocyanin